MIVGPPHICYREAQDCPIPRPKGIRCKAFPQPEENGSNTAHFVAERKGHNCILGKFLRIRTLTFHKGLYTVSLIEGDGIGPEISQSVKDIFTAAKVRRKFEGSRVNSDMK